MRTVLIISLFLLLIGCDSTPESQPNLLEPTVVVAPESELKQVFYSAETIQTLLSQSAQNTSSIEVSFGEDYFTINQAGERNVELQIRPKLEAGTLTFDIELPTTNAPAAAINRLSDGFLAVFTADLQTHGLDPSNLTQVTISNNQLEITGQ